MPDKIPDIRPSESPSETTIAASQPWKAGVIKLSDKVPRRADPPVCRARTMIPFSFAPKSERQYVQAPGQHRYRQHKSLGRSTDCKDQSFAVIRKICACDVLIHCYFNASLCAKCICNVYISTLSNTGQDSRSRAHTCSLISVSSVAAPAAAVVSAEAAAVVSAAAAVVVVLEAPEPQAAKDNVKH